ncbi:MAG: hypothetical protein SAL70_05330 [Scytonema sp. PMC 1070.18]|nr:hypothetical protein [Scytonema sp. PMC 1070.18]
MVIRIFDISNPGYTSKNCETIETRYLQDTGFLAFHTDARIAIANQHI